ncbi:hypothetical protein [Streptomyces sp. NPDC050856]|uniref:hypothetical protein n=1 Tax=Streptomyces sp. NPDC050856 TaxID=3154939 RepID=UPI0033D9C820
MGRTGTTRRRALLLTGAAATATATGLLTGCSTDGDPDGPAARERAARAEEALRRRSTATSAVLLARYDAVLAAHPPLGARLAPLRAAVAAHTAALAPPGTASPAAPPTGAAPSPATAPSPSPPAARRPAVPADPAAALRELATASRRTADAHTAALPAAPPEYARLLASVAAAGAAHAYLLSTAPGSGS